MDQSDSENASETAWAVLDSEGTPMKRGFETEEAAETWTTTDEGKQAVEKGGGSFTVEEISAEDASTDEDADV